jgi:hypothetical protein
MSLVGGYTQAANDAVAAVRNFIIFILFLLTVL